MADSTTKVWLDFLAPVMVAVIAWINIWASNRVIRKTEAVRVALLNGRQSTDIKLASLAIVAGKTHTLVNSAMCQQLMLYAITARTLANLTHKPEHITAADEADRVLAEHVAKQDVVDKEEGK